MRMTSSVTRFCHLTIMVVILCCLTGVVEASIEFEETLLTGDAAMDSEAALSGDYVTFTTNRSGSFDVYLVGQYGFVDPLAWGTGEQHEGDIDGTKSVYVDNSAGNDDIYLVDVETYDRQVLVFDAARDYSPAISGTNVVFVTNRSGTNDIYKYDLSSGFEDPVAWGPELQDFPAIDGLLVAWRQIDGLEYSIFAQYLDVGTPFQVYDAAGNVTKPSVSGNLIAYIIDYDVAVYDCNTAQTTRLTQDPHTQWAVIIDGNHVVWSDDRNGNFDIFLHDLTDGRTYQLTDDPADQMVTDIDGNTVVFEDDRYGNSNVWKIEFTIEYGTAVGQLDCSPTSGLLPFDTQFTVTLINDYPEMARRLDYQLNVTLASGASYTNYRRGYQNVWPGEPKVKSWAQTFPAYGTLVGDNEFQLIVTDVTPAPYNQPPYPPAGDTDTDSCTVTGVAP